MVTLCNPRAATLLSPNGCADCGRPLTKKVMSYLRDGQGVTAPMPNSAHWGVESPSFHYPPKNSSMLRWESPTTVCKTQFTELWENLWEGRLGHVMGGVQTYGGRKTHPPENFSACKKVLLVC